MIWELHIAISIASYKRNVDLSCPGSRPFSVYPKCIISSTLERLKMKLTLCKHPDRIFKNRNVKLQPKNYKITTSYILLFTPILKPHKRNYEIPIDGFNLSDTNLLF